MVLMVFLSSRNSPLTSTAIFLERSPLATAVVTSAILRTWAVRLPDIAQGGPLAKLSFLAAARAQALQLLGHALVQLDDFVERVRYLAGHAGPVDRQARREVAFLEGIERGQQGRSIHSVGQRFLHDLHMTTPRVVKDGSAASAPRT